MVQVFSSFRMHPSIVISVHLSQVVYSTTVYLNAMPNATLTSVSGPHRFRFTENRRTITSRMVYFFSAAAMPPFCIASPNVSGEGMST